MFLEHEIVKLKTRNILLAIFRVQHRVINMAISVDVTNIEIFSIYDSMKAVCNM